MSFKKISLFFLFILLFLFSMASCSSRLDHNNPFDPSTDVRFQKPASIEGYVSLENESDFSGVMIHLESNLTTKDSFTQGKDGNFSIKGIPPGEYTIIFSRRYYDPVSFTIRLNIGKNYSLGTVHLNLHRISVTGVVTLEDNTGKSPLGTIILLERIGNLPFKSSSYSFKNYSSEDTSYSFSGIAGPDGKFTIKGVPAGNYNLVAQKEGYAPYIQGKVEIGKKEDEKIHDVGTILLRKVTGDFEIVGHLADGTAPENLSNKYTATTEVTLNLYGFNAKDMKIGNEDSDGNCQFGEWKEYSATKNWYLSSGDGTKTVCVIFRGEDGKESEVLKSSIILDTTPPVVYRFVPIEGGYASKAGNTYYTSQAQIPIEAIVSDVSSGVESMEIVQDNGTGSWQDYIPYFSLTLASEGLHTVSYCFRDMAHNKVCSSLSENLLVFRDTQKPSNLSAKINNGNSFTNSYPVNIKASASDNGIISEIIISEDPSFAGAEWENYRNPVRFVLSGENGPKKVYVKVKDAAGNESDVASAEIILDTQPPGIYSVNVDNNYTNTQDITLHLKVQDNISPPEKIRVCIYGDIFSPCNPGDPSSFVSYSENKSVTITSGEGDKFIYAIFADEAGNYTLPVSTEIIYDRTPPSAPHLNTPTSGNRLVHLSWNNIADADHYLVYYTRVTTVDNNGNLIEKSGTEASNGPSPFIAKNNYVDVKGLINKTIYYFQVAAVDKAGNISALSNKVGPVIPGIDYKTITGKPGRGVGNSIYLIDNKIYITTYDLSRDKIVLFYSPDLGDTWYEKNVTDIVEETTNTLHYLFRSKVISDGNNIYLLYVDNNATSSSGDLFDIHFTYSPDNGETWTYSRKITSLATGLPAMGRYGNTLRITFGKGNIFYALKSTDNNFNWKWKQFTTNSNSIIINTDLSIYKGKLYANFISSSNDYPYSKYIYYLYPATETGWYSKLVASDTTTSGFLREVSKINFLKGKIYISTIWGGERQGLKILSSDDGGSTWATMLFIPFATSFFIDSFVDNTNKLYIISKNLTYNLPELFTIDGDNWKISFLDTYTGSGDSPYITGYGNGNIFSAYYNSTFRTLKLARTSLPAPFHAFPVLISENNFILRWSDMKDITTYQLSYQYGSNRGELTVNGTDSYQFTNFPIGTTIDVSVASLKNDTPGEFSNQISISLFSSFSVPNLKTYYNNSLFSLKKNGILYMALTYKQGYTDQPEIRFLKSEDNAQTWSVYDVADSVDDSVYGRVNRILSFDTDNQGRVYLTYYDGKNGEEGLKLMQSSDLTSWTSYNIISGNGTGITNYIRLYNNNLYISYRDDNSDSINLIKTDLSGNIQKSVTIDQGPGGNDSSHVGTHNILLVMPEKSKVIVIYDGGIWGTGPTSLNEIVCDLDLTSCNKKQLFNNVLIDELLNPDFDLKYKDSVLYLAYNRDNSLRLTRSYSYGATWEESTIGNFTGSSPTLAFGNNGEVYLLFRDYSGNLIMGKSFDNGITWNFVQVTTCNSNTNPVIEVLGEFPIIGRLVGTAECTPTGLVIDRGGNIWKPW